MIKCDWYWKLLKLSFFGLLISFFTLFVGSSVSALGATTTIWIVSSPSAVDSNYDITFLKWWWLLTSYLWVSKWILALRNNVLFWWTPNWLPYWYLHWDTNWRTDQWFFDWYYSCDELTGAWWPNNCTLWDNINLSGDNWTTIEIFKSFFSKVYADDYVYYDYYDHRYIGATSNWVSNYLKLCFSSHEIWKTLCFFGWYCWWVDRCPDWRFTSSQNYEDLKFSNIPYWSIWYAPWQNWYGWQFEGSQWWWWYWDVSWLLTGSVFQQECTVWYAKNYAENLWLSNFLCYWWLPIDSNWLALPVAWTGASVFDIFNASNDWKNFQTWFQYWQNIYTNRLVYDSSVWSWTPAPLYSYFNFVSQYWPTFSSREIQDYCRIILNNMDLSSSWHGISSWCPKVYWNWYAPWWGWGGSWDDDTWTWVQDNNSNNNINISVNWDWVWNHSWNDVKTPSAYIQDFFNKAREVIPTNFSDIWGWFLPTYIITFLCAIILFRFLRH